MFTQRSTFGWLGCLQARRPLAGQICLLAVALGIGVLGGCAVVSISAGNGTPRPTSGLVQTEAGTHGVHVPPAKPAASKVAPPDSLVGVSQISALTDRAQAAVVPAPSEPPTLSPARTPQAAETPQSTTSVEPTATTQPESTATPQSTAGPRPTATAVPQPTSQPTTPPASTPTGGGANLTLLGILVLVLCCAVTGIIVWLAATRHRQPPLRDRQPPVTD
jgi:hypothetical protein